MQGGLVCFLQPLPLIGNRLENVASVFWLEAALLSTGSNAST